MSAFCRSPAPVVGGPDCRILLLLALRILVLSVVILIATCGCARHSATGAHSSSTYIGIVKVTRPAATGLTSVTDVRALGIGWDEGLWLGWRAGSWIEADPSRCQLVIIIRSAAEAANAALVLRALEGMKPCVVDFTKSLSH